MYITILYVFLFILIIVLKNQKIRLENFDNNLKISVLILSYNRPWNLIKSIPNLLKLNMIDEIIDESLKERELDESYEIVE